MINYSSNDKETEYPKDFFIKYEILECLSASPSGETLLLSGLEDDKYYISKLSHEIDTSLTIALEGLNHNSLPMYIEHFQTASALISIREYVNGTPLNEYMNERPLSEEQVISIGIELCDVLEYLHNQTPPIIHRDVKPQNVIMSKDGHAVLIDFGIARTYKRSSKKDTVFCGTNDFAPPEQYGFSQTDARADIYSLGMLLRYLLTNGHLDGLIQHSQLRRIVGKCTAFSPERRYSKMSKLKHKLTTIASPKWKSSNTIFAVICALIIGVFIGRFAIPYVENQVLESRLTASGITIEYGRAEEYGFIPSDLTNSPPDSTVVTWDEYCQMMGNMIRTYDQNLYPKWKNMTASAPDTPMNRDGGMVSLLFAGELMKIDQFNSRPPASFGTYAPVVWQVVTMDYPIFDFNKYKKIDESCYDNNYVGPSYDYSLRRISLVSGNSLLEFNEAGDLKLEEPFTLRDAALSVLRLYESVDSSTN